VLFRSVNVNIAVKLLIHTPVAPKLPTAGIFFILLVVIFASGFLYLLVKYVRKKNPGE
jgi:hypothetical protein